MFELCEKGWTWGCSSQIDSTGRVLFTADAHRDNGKRFIVRADEKLTAFLELERITTDDSSKKIRFSTGPREGPVNANSRQFAAGFSYYFSGEMRSGLAAV